MHPSITIELDVSVPAHDLTEGRFDVAIRNGHGRWPGLRSVELFPRIFTPLCAPALKAAACNIGVPHTPLAIPLLGRPDWWTRWYRALGYDGEMPPDRFGTSLPTEYLDIAAAIAGHGIAIGSPILFRHEIAAGRLVPAHDFVATDGKSFWLAFPGAKENRRKIVRFREWLCAEAAAELHAARDYVRRAKAG